MCGVAYGKLGGHRESFDRQVFNGRTQSERIKWETFVSIVVMATRNAHNGKIRKGFGNPGSGHHIGIETNQHRRNGTPVSFNHGVGSQRC